MFQLKRFRFRANDEGGRIEMNYTDIAIDGQQLTELKKPMKRTGWRLKVKKPARAKALDPETATLLQFDQSGDDSIYDLDTENGAYLKILHDEKTNRTFILHNVFLNSVKNLLSIINHDLDPSDPGFVESVSTEKLHETEGWSFTYTMWVRDMAYNYDSQLLAISSSPTGERFTTGLYVFDLNKYIDEIVAEECGELKANPNYLSCEHWTAGDEPDKIVGGINSMKHLIAYHKGRFYSWVNCFSKFGIGTALPFYQLGYYSGPRDYEIIYQYGTSPLSTASTGYETNVFEPERTFPTYEARSCEISTGSWVSGTDGLYYGDPLAPLLNVNAINISRDGMLTMSCSPLDGNQYNFGAEGSVLLMDLSKEDDEPYSYEYTVHKAGQYDSASDQWKLGHATFTETVPVPAKGMVRVSVEHSNDSGISPNSWTVRAQGKYGSVKLEGSTIIGGQQGIDVKWAGDFFCYDEELKIGFQHADIVKSSYFDYSMKVKVECVPAMLVDLIGVNTEGAEIAQDSDEIRPYAEIWEDFNGEPWNMSKKQYITPPAYTVMNDALYDSATQKYFLAAQSNTDDGLGLWVMDCAGESRKLRKYKSSNSDLKYSRVTRIIDINDGYIGALSDDAGEPAHESGAGNMAVQFFNKKTEKFHQTVFDAAPLGYQNTLFSKNMIYDSETGLTGMCAGGISNGNASEAWIWAPPEEESAPGSLRVWWNGSDPDFIIGEEGPADGLGQSAGFFAPAWKQSKGQSSNAFTFQTQGAEYLPRVESPLNENKDLPGSYSGLLQDGSRMIVERGVWDGRKWEWIQEGQQFVMTLDVDCAGGDVEMNVETQGVISMIVNRSTYSGNHRPEELSFEDVALMSDDGGYSFYYQSGGTVYGDWAARPAPEVKVNGEFAQDYDISLGGGLVMFEEPQTDVTATFTTYIPGTNEAEDIIRCILSYPEELGGCGLDESWFTREVSGEILTTSDNQTYYFAKNNVVTDATENAIYVDGAPAGGYSWDFSAGSVTFSTPQTGVVTGDCQYFTIQKSGVTLEPMHFTPANGSNSYKSVEEVLRRVAPNYIMREGRDGKIEVDYFTQKPAGEEDIVIEDDDIILTSLNSGTSYEQIATRVLSIGSAGIEDLPNLCLGRPVTDLWPFGWHAGVDFQTITDGDPATGATAGWGGKENYRPIVEALALPENADGIPCISIDMGAEKQIGTIIIARPSQRSNEGVGNPDGVQRMSVDVSRDGADWTKIIDEFTIPPGGNEKFTDKVNFEEGTTFRYIRVNIHMIGLYIWEHTDSQMGISEVQCYPPDKIIGEARLQSEHPGEPLYDRWGLLDKYGVITHIARNGSADPALYTQEKADLDAQYCLEEIVRLMDKVTVASPWLPGIPVFSTVKVTNKSLGITRTFFVESRSAGEDGDAYDGVTLP